MAKKTTPRAGLPRRFTFKAWRMHRRQEGVIRHHCAMVVRMWNAMLEMVERAYRPIEVGRIELRWQQYDEPRTLRDGTKVEGQYVRHHLAHRDREHSDPEGKKLPSPVPTFFDFTAMITQLRRVAAEEGWEDNWNELSVWTAHRVADALTNAFQAYFRRMKELSKPGVYERRAAAFRARKGRNPTRHELAGYPRYKSVRKASWLPHRFKSGCKLVPMQRNGSRQRDWLLTMKGVPGAIRVRGRFPDVPLAWTDADLRWRDGAWWLSVCVDMRPRRQPGEHEIDIDFDCIDALATMTPGAPKPPSFAPLLELQERADAIKSERDTRWPRKPFEKPSRRHREATRRAAKLMAQAARQRREWLHEWSTAAQRYASSMTITAPSIKEHTQSGRGSEKEWGAAVETVAAINRHVLSQAPATAVAMLKYKAEEAGITCKGLEDERPSISVGSAIKRSTAAVRKAKRKLKELDSGGHPQRA